MSREIKFRVYDKADHPWYKNPNISRWSYFGPEYFINDDGYIQFEATQEGGPIGDHDQDRFSPIMQYTGLKDKNGKEIYEGDILEHKSKYNHVAGKFEVVYNLEDKDFAAFCLQRVDKKTWTKDLEGKLSGWEGVVGSQGHLIKELEVIGNIYENPELINEQMV
jgi:uncharacterized phage protein (TIGR01671 family)